MRESKLCVGLSCCFGGGGVFFLGGGVCVRGWWVGVWGTAGVVGILCLLSSTGEQNARRVSNAKTCVKSVETAVNKAACSSCELSARIYEKLTGLTFFFSFPFFLYCQKKDLVCGWTPNRMRKGDKVIWALAFLFYPYGCYQRNGLS